MQKYEIILNYRIYVTINFIKRNSDTRKNTAIYCMETPLETIYSYPYCQTLTVVPAWRFHFAVSRSALPLSARFHIEVGGHEDVIECHA